MKRSVAFQGADAKVGTTMIAQSIAEMIASSEKEIRVFFAACNGRSGTEYMDPIGEWMENLRLDLGNRVLSAEELMERCRQTDTYFFLAGVGGILCDRRYRPEMITFLSELLEDRVDLLIFDCGSEMDHALAVGAMECADERLCIVTQQESVIRRCEQLQELYTRMNLSVESYVMNKYTPEALYTPSYIGKRLDLGEREMYLVEKVPGSWRAESEKKTLLSYGRNDYNESIRGIANGILERAGLPALDRQRKGLWKNSI